MDRFKITAIHGLKAGYACRPPQEIQEMILPMLCAATNGTQEPNNALAKSKTST